MFKRLPFRPLGGLAALGTLAAMAATMIVAAPGGSAAAGSPGTSTAVTTETCSTGNMSYIESNEPTQGPEGGGTTVTLRGRGFRISGFYVTFLTSGGQGGGEAPILEELSGEEIKVISPPGKGSAEIKVHSICAFGGVSNGHFTYLPPVEKAEYKNWILAGSFTDKKLGQLITLPEDSIFNGHGEINTETGVGSEKGNVSIPPFNASLRLFGLLPLNLGLTLSQEGALEGTVAKSETVSGDEALALPVKLNLGITSLKLLGLTIRTKCATTEALSLNLTDNLTNEELLTKGWSFSGATVIPKVRCESGLLGSLFGLVLSGLLSGPENSYAIKVAAPNE